ncbi:MAG: hypothetical protein ACI94Y_003659 [Maribacter sp.]|jgi:hypothetical protein
MRIIEKLRKPAPFLGVVKSIDINELPFYEKHILSRFLSGTTFLYSSFLDVSFDKILCLIILYKCRYNRHFVLE